eukprot:scaffold88994_cov50-Phaeocystis_antarctica.AAC.3
MKQLFQRRVRSTVNPKQSHEYRASQTNLHVVGRRGPAQPGGADHELCAMVDGSSQCTIVLPEDCLGYGLVVPFLAYRFALWFRIMKT